MPDPWTAIVQGLGSVGNPFGGFGGMPMGGMQMMQQAPTQQATTETAKPEAAPEPPKQEKTIFDIKLEAVDAAKKINLIKELRKIDPSLGIKQAKELVDVLPSVIKKDVPKEEAEKIQKALAEFGTVTLQ
jgi:large subunit ribosomal protein L7/L12